MVVNLIEWCGFENSNSETEAVRGEEDKIRKLNVFIAAKILNQNSFCDSPGFNKLSYIDRHHTTRVIRMRRGH